MSCYSMHGVGTSITQLASRDRTRPGLREAESLKEGV